MLDYEEAEEGTPEQWHRDLVDAIRMLAEDWGNAYLIDLDALYQPEDIDELSLVEITDLNELNDVDIFYDGKGDDFDRDCYWKVTQWRK